MSTGWARGSSSAQAMHAGCTVHSASTSRLDHATCRQVEIHVKKPVDTFEAESSAEETVAAAKTEQPRKSSAVRRKN